MWLHCCMLSTRGQERPTQEAPRAPAAELGEGHSLLGWGAGWSGRSREGEEEKLDLNALLLWAFPSPEAR